MEETLKKITDIIAKNDDLNSDISPELIQLNHSFKHDLCFDSISLMSLAYELQEEYPDLDEMSISE